MILIMGGMNEDITEEAVKKLTFIEDMTEDEVN